MITISLPLGACITCPARAECTTSHQRGRQITVQPQPQHEALQAARAEQATDPWKRDYRAFAATAVNLIRLDAWWTHTPLRRTGQIEPAFRQFHPG